MNPDLRTVHASLIAMLQQLEEAPTAEQRAIRASELWQHVHRVVQPAITKERRAAVRALRAQGYTLAAIGDLLGVNDSRVAQIARGYDKREPR